MASEEYKVFLGKQNGIYDDKFRAAEKIVAQEGLKCGVPTPAKGGYLVAFRHPKEEVAEPVGRFSGRISEVLGGRAIKYGADTIHTTIRDYDVREGFEPDEEILSKLRMVVLQVMGEKAPLIRYDEWLYNQTSVIVAGQPDEQFLGLAKKVAKNARNQGIELGLPWGAHITASRPTEDIPPEQLRDFQRLMREAPVIGESRPTCIDVGYFDFSSNGFDFTTCERFALR